MSGGRSKQRHTPSDSKSRNPRASAPLEHVDWQKALDDVRPLIERESDLAQLAKENILNLLESRGGKTRP